MSRSCTLGLTSLRAVVAGGSPGKKTVEVLDSVRAVVGEKKHFPTKGFLS